MNRKMMSLLISISCLFACNDNVAQRKREEVIYHYNIIIAPDFSNRLTVHHKPVADTAIVSALIADIYPKVLTYKRKMNQLDKFQIDFINEKQVLVYNIDAAALCIDFKKFKSQSERIAYLQPANANSRFIDDKRKFMKEFCRISMGMQGKDGADIWTYLNEGLDMYKIDTTVYRTTYDNVTYVNQYKNIVILLTDGYLESVNKSSNNKLSRGFSQSNIQRFRNDYQKRAGGESIDMFIQKNGYGIMPVNNPVLKYIELLVMEIDDRSIDEKGAKVFPTDRDIIFSFWKDWLTKSGIKRFELLKTVSTKAEADSRMLSFVGIDK